MRPFIFFIVLFFPLACTRKPAAVVVLDGWWNADFAEGTCYQANAWYKQPGTALVIAQLGCNAVTSCPQMMPVVNACILGDPSPEVRDFENRLATEFAIDPACHNSTLVRIDNPKNPDAQVVKALAEPHWFLTLDFIPGSAEQNWKLLSSDHKLNVGKGDPKSITHSICLAASQRGGSVAN